MLRTLPFALLLELFAHVCASPVADAAHPMITQRAELFGRDVAPGFIGYYNTTDDSGNPVFSPSELTSSISTVRDGNLIDFCSNDEAYLSSTCPDAYWTSCSGVTLYSAGGSSACSTTCDYDIVYTGSTPDSNSFRWYHCMTRTWVAFYREEPQVTSVDDTSTEDSSASETSSDSSSAGASATDSITSSTSPASSSANTIASETVGSTPTSEPPKEKSGENKAWIAGVVIGTVGLLAVAGMGFFLWRQRQQKHAYGPAPQGPPQTLQAPQEYTPQQAAYKGYYNPQQVPYGSGPSPNIQPVSPNMLAYDTSAYGQAGKPVEMYAGYDGAPPPGVGTMQMQPGTAYAQPHMAAEIHELPELAPPTKP